MKEEIRRQLAGPATKYTVEHMRREVFRRLNRDTLPALCRELEVSERRIRQLYEEGLKLRAGSIDSSCSHISTDADWSVR